MIRRVLGTTLLLSLFTVANAQAAVPPKHEQDIFQMAREGKFTSPPLTLGHKVATAPNGQVLSKATIKKEHKWTRPSSRVAGASVTPSCTGIGFWVAGATAEYVTTELGYAGWEHALLRARASAIGEWEHWQMCWGFNGYSNWEIWSPAAQRWVSADISLSGEMNGALRAEGTGIAAWERFNATEGLHNFQANINGRWVSTEIGQTGGRWAMLRARATAIGPWEQYTFCC